MNALSAGDFPTFFRELHGQDPFPWQSRLITQIAEQGMWPEVLDIPTGLGKTSVLDIAIFHLALEAQTGTRRRAPLRIALIVDRRLVVDDAYARAGKIVLALSNPPGPITGLVQNALQTLAGTNAPPLLATKLRGGMPRESDWARTPSQPTILCSTVDQVGSRLLFRGYGVSDSMKPVHAGLLGADCLMLLDEAHISEPFRQTLEWVRHYHEAKWREESDAASPWSYVSLTATPGKQSLTRFSLNEDDQAHPIVRQRMSAAKPARLITLNKKETQNPAEQPKELASDEGEALETSRVQCFQKETWNALTQMRTDGIPAPAIAIIANRVRRARRIFEALRKDTRFSETDRLLLIGPSRPCDRDRLVKQIDPIRTGAEPRNLSRPLLIVATQCLEVGVDIDLDGLITDAAPLDSLRQRFGRLNRAGRKIQPQAVIIGEPGKPKIDDIYGKALGAAWEFLQAHAAKTSKKEPKFDFGLKAISQMLAELPASNDLYTEKTDAPILLPAHLDLLSQTAPIPNADPEISLYLHGPACATDSISVVWRADLDPEWQLANDDLRRLLILMPPRTGEAVELPIGTIRHWLTRTNSKHELADIPAKEPDEEPIHKSDKNNQVFRWRGDDDASCWINPSQLRPGDTIIVPASLRGLDEFGWHPESELPVKDIADEAARPYQGRVFSLRIAPGLLGENLTAEYLAAQLASASSSRWNNIRDLLLDLNLPDAIHTNLGRLWNEKVKVYDDIYGKTTAAEPRGLVLHLPGGFKEPTTSDAASYMASTEDDLAGSLEQSDGDRDLVSHLQAVAEQTSHFTHQLRLPATLADDLILAAQLHDLGKLDPRFQAWLCYGDPLGPDPNHLLAKSGRRLPSRAYENSNLPKYWRHEAFSVRLAPLTPTFKKAHDRELVLWLIGTHHGQGRPLFPHADPLDETERKNLPSVQGAPTELLPGLGPQSLTFDWEGWDWPSLFVRLQRRYGHWELARFEAILRLADHRASEAANTNRQTSGAAA